MSPERNSRCSAPTPSEPVKLGGGRPTACPHLGEEPRPVLGIVAWQISTAQLRDRGPSIIQVQGANQKMA